MDTNIYIIRWKDGTFSIQIGASEHGIVDDIESVADPRLAEIRILPPRLRTGWMLFNQQKKGSDFQLEVGESTNYQKELWEKCKKVVWPSDDYPISDNLAARIRRCEGDGLKAGPETQTEDEN